MIRVEALGKSFDNKKVLSDIDITFEAGKVNLIIGKSGSGKTVCIRLRPVIFITVTAI